jgi:hypothetical protein
MGELWTPNGWRDRRSTRLTSLRPRRRTESRRRLLLLTVLCLAWLGLLLWPGPKLGTFLSAQTARLAHATGQVITRAVTVGTNHPPGATTSGGVHMAWQVGLAAVEAPDSDSGVRTVIQTRVPQRVSDQTTNYFWVGAYLSDGSFLQAGYYIPWYDDAHAGWFYCAFAAGGQKGPCSLGPLGSAGANGSRHTYTIETVPGTTAGKIDWRATMDGTTVGQFTWTAGSTGAYMPGIYAESSGFAPHAAASQLGPVDFSGGVQVRPSGQTGYVTAPHAQVQYNAANICPPYGVATDGAGGALLGSGLDCPVGDSLLW